MRRQAVYLQLDPPRTDLLLAWAADPQQRLPIDIVVFNAAGGQAYETL